jgi:hypothetical protein
MTNKFDFSFNNKTDAKNIFIIFIVAILGMQILIANPGYYNHDELQKFDHIYRYGFPDYISAYVTNLYANLTQSPFGAPVRPIPFFIEGLLAFFMQDYPIIVHFLDVLSHALVSATLYLAVLRFGLKRQFALLGALIFLLNPIGVLSAGASATLMDRWYVFFGIIAFLFAESYIKRNSSAFTLIGAFLFSGAAILSKETAVMLPGMLIIFLIFDFSLFKEKRFYLSLIAITLPISIFFSLRLPALLHSASNLSGHYAISFDNFFPGVLSYFSYPFLITIAEIGNYIFLSSSIIFLAVLIHVGILIFLWRYVGIKFLLAYLYCYFLFLIPVIFISGRATPYLYASSVFLSLAIAWMIYQSFYKSIFFKFYSIFICILLLVHTLVVEVFLYQLGSCMSKAMITLEAVHINEGKPTSVELRAMPNAPGYVIGRFATGREIIGESFPVSMKVTNWGDPISNSNIIFNMDNKCRIFSSKNY